MTIDHVSELLVGFQPLPFERRAPVLEEPSCPALVLVAPELSKGLLENIGGVQPFVGAQQGPQCLSALQREVLLARQQRVFLPLDEAALLSRQARVLALSHLIESFAQVANDVELVEQDCGLRGVGIGGVAKRFPHVHHGEADSLAFLLAKPLITLSHAGFRAIAATEPDWSLANEVADYDPVVMPLADRDLVDADHRWPRSSRLGQLGAHVLLVQLLHCMPVEPELFGDIADRSAAATPANVKGKSLGVERIVREEVETLALHLTALAAPNAPHLELQKYAQAASRKVANSADLAVVPSGMFSSACAAGCFFERRTRAMMRACGSPNTPRTSSIGRKPKNRYASSRRRRFVEVTRIRPRCRHQSTPQHPLRFASEIRALIEANKAVIHGLFTTVLAQNSPTRLHEDPQKGVGRLGPTGELRRPLEALFAEPQQRPKQLPIAEREKENSQ